MKKIFVLAAALALTGLSSTAFAAEGPYGFARAEAGNSEIEYAGDKLDDSSYSVRGGYFFNANVGIEGFYSNFGEGSDDFGTKAQLSGYGVGVVGKKNLGADNLGFFFAGRVGAVHTESEITYPVLGRFEDSSTKLYLGVGIGWDFNDTVGISLNYDHHKADAFDESLTAETLSAGVEVRF